MESQSRPAHIALHEVRAVRARVAQLPRGHAALQLAYSVLIAAYMGVFVYTGSTEGGASVFGGTTMALLVPPIVISTGLITGANERFAARQRATARQWVAIAFFLAALGVILIWGIAGGGYPWWLSLVYAVATLLLFGIRPLAVLVRAPAAEPEGHGTLTRSARTVTIAIGVLFGLSCAVALLPAVSAIVMAIGMVAAIIGLAAQTSQWGLLRVGHQWRRAQWAGFGAAAAVMFALAVLIIATEVVTPVVAIGAGIVAAAALTGAAFRPGGADGTPAA